MDAKINVGNLTKKITVNNSASLNDALNDEYGVIIVEGDAAEEFRKTLKGYRRKKKLSKFFNWVFPLTYFNLLFFPVALLGKLATSDKVDKYRVSIEEKTQTVLLVHKKVTLSENKDIDPTSFTEDSIIISVRP